MATVALVLTGCPSTDAEPDQAGITEAATPDGGFFAQPTPTEVPGTATSPPDTPPVPYIPAGRVGDQQAYDDLIARLSLELPDDLAASAPWPDLRHADPTVAQRQIFAFWIWVTENAPQSVLADAIVHPDGPARPYPVQVFAELQSNGHLERRPNGTYEVLDQTVATFESTDLPLWLARNVPEPAVVVWYNDRSGPVQTIDDQGRVVTESLPTPLRDWLAIMVQTDVGWLLWVDELIDISETELQRPDLPAPGSARPTPSARDV